MWATDRERNIIREYGEALRHMRDSGRITDKQWRWYKDRLMNALSKEECEKIYREAMHEARKSNK